MKSMIFPRAKGTAMEMPEEIKRRPTAAEKSIKH
jgi:hypothetical protein